VGLTRSNPRRECLSQKGKRTEKSQRWNYVAWWKYADFQARRRDDFKTSRIPVLRCNCATARILLPRQVLAELLHDHDLSDHN
jgi:hypothetical protein